MPSQLLDAIAGVPNGREPFTDFVTGGQPEERHFRALRAAGCEVVLDVRDPMEPRPIDEAAVARAVGLDYVAIPVSSASLTDATLTRVLDTVRTLAGKRRCFMHCGSGNRVGASLIPYFILDRQLSEEDAIDQATILGTRSAELVEWALDFVRRREKTV